MTPPKTYDTLSEAINNLALKGYTFNFNTQAVCDEATEPKTLPSNEYEIDEIHRFEGMNDPGDSNILYAISSKNHRIKGLLVNAYGAYSDTYSAKLAQKLKMHFE